MWPVTKESLTSILGKFGGGHPVDHFDNEQRVARGGRSGGGRRSGRNRNERGGVDLVLDMKSHLLYIFCLRQQKSECIDVVHFGFSFNQDSPIRFPSPDDTEIFSSEVWPISIMIHYYSMNPCSPLDVEHCRCRNNHSREISVLRENNMTR